MPTTDNISRAIEFIHDGNAREIEFNGAWLDGTSEATDVNGCIWIDGDEWNTEIWAVNWLSDDAPIVPSPCADSSDGLAERLHKAGYTIIDFWDAFAESNDGNAA